MKLILALFTVLVFCKSLQAQVFYIGVNPSWLSSTYYDTSITYTNLTKQTSFYNSSLNYGVSVMYMNSSHLSYYQSKRYAFKIGLDYASVRYKTVYWTPKLGVDSIIIFKKDFIDLSFLLSTISTNHQIFSTEFGPSLTFYLNENRFVPTFRLKNGIYSHITDRVTYSILLSTGFTLLNRSSYRFWFGIELNTYYRTTKRVRRYR